MELVKKNVRAYQSNIDSRRAPNTRVQFKNSTPVLRLLRLDLGITKDRTWSGHAADAANHTCRARQIDLPGRP
jgi:hypothetical protein